MSTYVYPGYPAFLQRAATELGHPESALPAGRIAALTALANLCSQASQADPSRVADILAKAGEFRDHLRTALLAADLMLAEVEAGCATQAAPPEPGPMPTDTPRSSRVGANKFMRGPQ